MTAAAFADLVQAKRSGAGRWQARCPAHSDRSPSLSICLGGDGRVLLHCFAGCSLDSILAALQLRRCDLFDGPPPTAEQARQLARQRARHEAEARAQRATYRAACDRVRRLESVADALFAKAARLSTPDGDAVAVLGHEALRRLRVAEAELEALQ